MTTPAMRFLQIAAFVHVLCGAILALEHVFSRAFYSLLDGAASTLLAWASFWTLTTLLLVLIALLVLRDRRPDDCQPQDGAKGGVLAISSIGTPLGALANIPNFTIVFVVAYVSLVTICSFVIVSLVETSLLKLAQAAGDFLPALLVWLFASAKLLRISRGVQE